MASKTEKRYRDAFILGMEVAARECADGEPATEEEYLRSASLFGAERAPGDERWKEAFVQGYGVVLKALEDFTAGRTPRTVKPPRKYAKDAPVIATNGRRFRIVSSTWLPVRRTYDYTVVDSQGRHSHWLEGELEKDYAAARAATEAPAPTVEEALRPPLFRPAYYQERPETPAEVKYTDLHIKKHRDSDGEAEE